METFAQARERILAELARRGWTVQQYDQRTGRPLKVPHATTHRARLWFKPQSVYVSRGVPPHALGDARSICSDYRGVTAETLERAAE